MIDTEGIVFYINDQCAKYLQVNKEDFLGKYVKDVFPETKMIEGLEKDEPSIVFYYSFLGIGISMHVPLYEDGKKGRAGRNTMWCSILKGSMSFRTATRRSWIRSSSSSQVN